jgi:hypothetical protein
MANRDILKEAIADAKSIKEAAIANAKVALEEAFTPYLKEKLSAKLAEIDSMDEEMDENKATSASEKETGYRKVAHHQALKNSHYDDLKEDMDEEMDEEKMQFEDMDEDMDESKSMDEMDLDELLRELEDMDEEMDENMDETINDPRGPGAHGNVAPTAQNDTDLNEAKEGDEEEDVEIDIENMSEEDLKSFIEGVIADMVAAGELEAGHEGMEGEEGAEGEEEVSLDELMDEMDESSGYTEKAKHQAMSNDDYETMGEGTNPKDSGYTKTAKHQPMKNGHYETEEVEEGKNPKDSGYTKMAKHQAMKNSHYEREMDEMKKDLDEAFKTIEAIKSELNEVNLLNSKLLYLNKVFKAKNLTESQKVKVLAAFDKATSKKEAKLVYETVMESLNNTNTTKRPVTESVRGMASKVISGTNNSTKQPIIEVNAAFERMQKLAGIKK